MTVSPENIMLCEEMKTEKRVALLKMIHQELDMLQSTAPDLLKEKIKDYLDYIKNYKKLIADYDLITNPPNGKALLKVKLHAKDSDFLQIHVL